MYKNIYFTCETDYLRKRDMIFNKYSLFWKTQLAWNYGKD